MSKWLERVKSGNAKTAESRPRRGLALPGAGHLRPVPRGREQPPCAKPDQTLPGGPASTPGGGQTAGGAAAAREKGERRNNAEEHEHGQADHISQQLHVGHRQQGDCGRYRAADRPGGRTRPFPRRKPTLTHTHRATGQGPTPGNYKQIERRDPKYPDSDKRFLTRSATSAFRQARQGMHREKAINSRMNSSLKLVAAIGSP